MMMKAMKMGLVTELSSEMTIQSGLSWIRLSSPLLEALSRKALKR